MGLSLKRFCVNGLAWGHRGGPCTIRTLHKSTLSVGGWLVVGVARVFRVQSASQVSELRSENSCKSHETHVASKPRFQRQGPAELQPYRHGGEYLRCRIRCRIRYCIFYIVYDIVCDIVYDIVGITILSERLQISRTLSLEPSLACHMCLKIFAALF